MTSFGSNNIAISKSDFNLCEHGINLKLSALRLGSSVLILTKTKPKFEFGTSSQYLSIGLLSYKFLQKCNSQFLVAPMIAFEIRNKKIYRPLTPNPYYFLEIMAKYTGPLFSKGD